MKSCGIITTIMDLRKVKEWWFNVPLLVFHLAFLIVGTAYGKVKWDRKVDIIEKLGSIMAVIISLGGLVASVYNLHFWVSPIFILLILIAIATYRGIDWRKVWQAAKVSHVRLVLEPVTTSNGISDRFFWCADFGYPKMEVEVWDTDWTDGKRFKYYDPTFSPSDEFIAAMIEYAEKQVGKGYDDLQLISNGLHLIAWIVYPPCWGKELKIIKALNRPGGREHCISGVTACLRNADDIKMLRAFKEYTGKTLYPNEQYSKFFPGYSTAVIPPCLAPLSKNWKEGDAT